MILNFKKALVAVVVAGITVLSCTSVKKDIYIKDRNGLQKEIRIAVFPFKDAPGSDGAGSGVAFADALTGELIKIDNWQVIERSQLEKIVQEKSLNMTGMTDADYTKIAQISRVDYVVVGSVSQFEYERSILNVFVPKTKISFKGRIINAETGAVVGTISYTRETGKYAILGCCILSFYYIPVALLVEENKYAELDKVAEDVAEKISGDVSDKKGCL
ncbi:MAG TPA: CsgG/HfaB family protein [Spirochaetota bacterium]|jgi:curli biogenesis system outer membrane secretion channel CsgG|nr:hypothetical protein [Spirochaetota bacterium]HQO40842.1 CsgG/HfaB family protein [Spirochaetota bacterium]